MREGGKRNKDRQRGEKRGIDERVKKQKRPWTNRGEREREKTTYDKDRKGRSKKKVRKKNRKERNRMREMWRNKVIYRERLSYTDTEER